MLPEPCHDDKHVFGPIPKQGRHGAICKVCRQTLCSKPLPDWWACSRLEGHEGPCHNAWAAEAAPRKGYMR